MSEVTLSLVYGGPVASVTCAGELDVLSSRKLRDAIDICLDEEPQRFRLDGSGIALLTSSGIEVLVYALKRCRSDSIGFELLLSPHARRILDLVGLWWLGVVDEGFSLDDSLLEAQRAYASLGADQRARLRE